MATLFNNTKITNAFFNGTELDKIYFNGVLVFEKGRKYKRRIMVGDNLSNRTIFQDFPDGFYKSGMSDGEQLNLIESNNINIYEYYIGGSYNVYCGNRTNSNLLYRYDSVIGRTMTKKDVTTGTYLNAIVTEVNENKTYRHLFIEDENIRPLEVGDVITRNTKFYFTIPDDIFSKTNIGTNPIRLDNGSTLSVLEHSSPKRIRFFVNDAISSANDVVVYENDKITKNKSSIIVSPVNGNYFEGTVSRVTSNSLVYNMTFVDVRTLG